MKVFVPDLEKHAGEPLAFLRRATLESLDIDLLDNDQAVMTVNFQASSIAGRVLIKGYWQAELCGECSRCLEPATYHITEHFTEEFVPFNGSVNVDDPEGDDILVYSGDMLDLKEYLRQSFLISLPLRTLCREDCRGLCPVCGANRNREECSCREDNVDPRLNVLRSLKEKYRKE